MSRSPRRKAIKAYDLARKRYELRALMVHAELIAARDAYESEMRRMRDDFAPRLDKLASVTVGVPFEEHHAPEFMWDVPEERPMEVPYTIITTPTHRDARISVAFPTELILMIGRPDYRPLIEELSKRVQRVTAHALGVLFRGER